MSFSLRQLRVFLAVYSARSVVGAAGLLNVTPSAVSTALRELEAVLGEALFVRSTRRLEPTPAAVAVAASAARIVAQAEAFPAAVRAAAAKSAGQVIFAASAAVAATLGPPLLERCRRIHPQISVRMLDVAPEDLIEMVRRGDVAFGIGTHGHAEPDMVFDVLVEDRVSLVTWAGGPFSGLPEVAWHQLDGQETISVAPGTAIRDLLDSVLNKEEIAFRPAMETRFLATAIGLARQRLGVLVLPASLLSAPGMQEWEVIPLVRPSVRRSISIVRPISDRLTPSDRLVIEEAGVVARAGIGSRGP